MPASDLQKQALEYLNEGARLMHARRYAEALPILERAYALLPDDPDVLVTLGGALIMTSKWQRAEAILEKAVEKHPYHAQLWLNLAAAYLGRLEISSRSRQEKAIAAYKKAIEIDPVAPSAHYNIALIYSERKDWAAAVEWFAAAVRANPADRDASLLLAKARRKLAEEEES